MESYKKQREEELRVKMDVQKLLGDSKSLMEELDEYLRQVNKEEQKFRDFQQTIDVEKLEVDDKQKLNEAIEKIEFARFRGEKVKKDLTDLQNKTIVIEGKVEKTKILGPIFEQILKGLEVLLGSFALISSIIKALIVVAWEQLKKDNYAVLKKIALDLAINQADKFGMKDAKEFWQFSSDQKINEYITENGKIYEKISDLNNNKLETIIRTKLNSQLKIKEARGVVFHHDSSISQEIVKSNTLKNFIHGKQNLLLEKRILPDGSLNFSSADSPNLHNALGHTDIIDIKLDNENNLIAKISDTYE